MNKAKFAVLSAFSAVILSSCFFFPKEEPLLPPPVIKQDEVTYVTYSARKADITNRVVAGGYVVSRVEADCFFTAYTGNIKAIYPRPGDYVEEGDLIAELDAGELAFDVETARLKAELARLDYAASGKEAAKLAYELAQNTYEQLRTRMDGSVVTAPMSGRVSFTESLRPGEEVNPYRVLARISDPAALCAAARLNDTNTDAFEVGVAVEIVVGGVSYGGVVAQTPKSAKAAATDDDRLIAEFGDTAPDFAEMGNFADIAVIKGKSVGAIVIPRNLVKSSGGKTYVQILDDDEVKKDVEVVTGIVNATEIEIVSGLREGQRVVVK